MFRFSRVLTTLTLVVAMASVSQAASVVVSTDSGNVGELTFTNAGIVGSTATINVSVPSLTSAINTVNGAIVAPELIKVTTPLTFTVTPTGGNLYNLTLPGNVTKTVGAVVGQQAIMGFNLTQGATIATLPNFFNASGPITSLVSNNNPSYDFGLFGLPGGRINLTFTATTFTNTTSFAGLFTTVGATAVGNGSLSQQAVPEPASLATLGLGLAGAVAGTAIRRRLVKCNA